MRLFLGCLVVLFGLASVANAQVAPKPASPPTVIVAQHKGLFTRLLEHRVQRLQNRLDRHDPILLVPTVPAAPKAETLLAPKK